MKKVLGLLIAFSLAGCSLISFDAPPLDPPRVEPPRKSAPVKVEDPLQGRSMAAPFAPPSGGEYISTGEEYIDILTTAEGQPSNYEWNVKPPGKDWRVVSTQKDVTIRLVPGGLWQIELTVNYLHEASAGVLYSASKSIEVDATNTIPDVWIFSDGFGTGDASMWSTVAG